MPETDLHTRYAPIMRFSRGERFFPMAMDDFLAYTALYSKGSQRPAVPRGQVTADDLQRRGADELFLRSVEGGPLTGAEVADQWGTTTLKLLWEATSKPLVAWTPTLAGLTYRWFSEKTSAATQRFWWNDLVFAQLSRALGTDLGRDDLPRFVLPGDMRQAAITAYDESQAGRPRFTYYYRTVREGDYLNLQYWFFYAYNDWGNGYGGFNDHEGDWEGFHIFFKLDGGRPVEPPAFVCFLGHESRLTKPWDHPDVERDGTHPVIYVAAGSHASYPQSKLYPLVTLYNLIDYATGDARTLAHTDWVNRIALTDSSDLALLNYRGSWGTRYWLNLNWLQTSLRHVTAAGNVLAYVLPGEITLPGISAPRGPRFDTAGRERETWRNPLAFAGIA